MPDVADTISASPETEERIPEGVTHFFNTYYQKNPLSFADQKRERATLSYHESAPDIILRGSRTKQNTTSSI